jgi:hypothetical protein
VRPNQALELTGASRRQLTARAFDNCTVRAERSFDESSERHVMEGADPRSHAPRTALTAAVPVVVRAKNGLDTAEPAWSTRGNASKRLTRRDRTQIRLDRGEPSEFARRTAAPAKDAIPESARPGPRRTELPARPDRRARVDARRLGAKNRSSTGNPPCPRARTALQHSHRPKCTRAESPRSRGWRQDHARNRLLREEPSSFARRAAPPARKPRAETTSFCPRQERRARTLSCLVPRRKRGSAHEAPLFSGETLSIACPKRLAAGRIARARNRPARGRDPMVGAMVARCWCRIAFARSLLERSGCHGATHPFSVAKSLPWHFRQRSSSLNSSALPSPLGVVEHAAAADRAGRCAPVPAADPQALGGWLS